jgi:hypothetical protein
MSYYKIIDGIKYDKAILDTADEQIKTNGKLSENDMKLILKDILDSKKITKIEYLTIFYIIKNYNITPIALDKFAEDLSTILQLI